MLAVELPPGSRLEDTRKLTSLLTERISARPEVTSVFVNGGQVLGSGAEVRKATLVIRYFMHVKWSHILSKMALEGAVLFLAIMLVLMSMDYVSRGWQPPSMPWDHHQVLNN